MPRLKAVAVPEEKPLEPITPVQQQFIEALLSGKTISAAALAAGISRRTATYWLADPHHPVTLDYEKQRLAQQDAFTARVATLHEMALKAMEDALSPDAPAGIRFQAAKFLYEKHLEHVCTVREPKQPDKLIAAEASLVQDREHFNTFNAHRLRNIPD